MVLSIIFLEDKHNVVLHLSIFYEHQQFFSTPYLFLDTAQLQIVNLHRNRRYFVINLHSWFCLEVLRSNCWNVLIWVTGHCNWAAVSRNRYGVEKTVDTHKTLINAIKCAFITQWNYKRMHSILIIIFKSHQNLI